MSPGYRITLDVVTELDPEAVRHIVQTELQDVLEITRLLVGAAWNHGRRRDLRRTELADLWHSLTPPEQAEADVPAGLALTAVSSRHGTAPLVR